MSGRVRIVELVLFILSGQLKNKLEFYVVGFD